MTPKLENNDKKRFSILGILLAGFVVALLLVAGGFGFASTQETRDSFCVSCHTQPESIFFQRSTEAQPVDLASFHTAQETRCIDCHSGQGVPARMQAELLGAHNAFLWYSGNAVQPAPLKVPIADQNCLKCHEAITQRGYAPKEQITVPGVRSRERGGEEGGPNHWHENLARWQAADSNAGTCNSCHSGHVNSSTVQAGFMDGNTVQATCEACHQVLRHEGRG